MCSSDLPKPSQYRFYTRGVGDSAPKGFRSGESLRGRKVYWHHTQWSLRSAERREVKDSKDKRLSERGQRDGQNRSIARWVRAGSSFSVTIDVRAAERSDVAALAWLLLMAMGDTPAHLRFGYGKPLGFGSCKVTALSCQLDSGTRVASRWATLTEDAEATIGTVDELKALAQGFRTLGPEQTDYIKEYLAVARGRSNVDYPRGHRRPDGSVSPIYEWFRDNKDETLPKASSADPALKSRRR